MSILTTVVNWLKPSQIYRSITVHDTNSQALSDRPRACISEFPRALYIGVGGDVVVVDHEDQSVTFKNVPTGTMLEISPKIVKSTGTTATNIVGIW